MVLSLLMINMGLLGRIKSLRSVPAVNVFIAGYDSETSKESVTDCCCDSDGYRFVF